MEFFAVVEKAISAEELQARLVISSLPQFCASISQLLSHDGDRGAVYCVWGQFVVNREPIRGGVRFTLPKCPNALAWTVTTGLPPSPQSTVVHCTINRTTHDPDFIASIEKFMADWRCGLEAAL
jgi:hypothetical protein